MEHKNRFTGTHSKVIINLDHVMFATSKGYSGSECIVTFVGGKEIMLDKDDATTFLAWWRAN